MENFYIREIREEEYSMENEMAGGIKPQIIAGGKNEKLSEEKIRFREIRKEEYRKMKNDIREINEEGYSMEMKNDNEKIHIREMNEEGYSMMENEISEMEREFDNDEMENEINDEMFNEEEYMEN